mmetsp:Transcript_5543/g.6439  ORF Transcript_5543/g.6439 Transcript_5543/m.6439 type:complete len:631 (+) Transcript_5543:51-1943(+)
MIMTLSRQWNLLILLNILPFSSSFAIHGRDNIFTFSSVPIISSRLATQRRTEEYHADVIIPESANNNKRIRGTTAPVVDSTLLRFLSEQKLLGRLREANKKEVDQESWLRQFMSERVANTLIDCGAPRTAAYEAAMVVQSYVLSRTKQRRVRDFLKKRDMAWVKGNDVESQLSFNEIAEYGIDDVISLLLENGLSGYDIAVILTHTPGIAMMMPRTPPKHLQIKLDGKTLEETFDNAYKGLLLGKLNLKKYDAKKILRLCPGLLTMGGSKRAEDVIILMTSMGVSLKSLARDKKGLTVLLSRAPSSIFRLITFLASDVLRIPVSQIGPLLRNRQCRQLLDAVAPVSFVEPCHFCKTSSYEHVKGGVSSNEVGKKRQSINDAFKKMTKTAWTLQNHIGTRDLGNVIAAYPNVLLLDVNKQILPNAAYLMNELGICQDDLPRVLQLYPFLLGKNIKEMEATVSYLMDLGVEEEKLPSIFRAFPSLLSMDEKSMEPVIDFLKEIGIANIGRFVTRMPSVLGYSLDDLKPKWTFLSEVCLYPSFELSTFPAYFSYPIDRVTKTRYEYLRYVKKIPTELLALDFVLRYGDDDFAKVVAKDKDGGNKFATFVRLRAERLKKLKKRRKRIGSQVTES